MRLDHRRDRAAALLCVALLAAWGMPTAASAQDPGLQGFQQTPPGLSPDEGQPGQPPQGQDGAATAAEAEGRPSPVDLDAVPADTSPLARYVPAEAAGIFFEFPGLNAAPDAWKGSTAYGMLHETSLGTMLRELTAQVVEAAPDAPAGTMNGPEVVAVLEHIARHGLVFASPQDFERQAQYSVLVLRNAAHREVRGLFGKVIGTIAPEGAKPEVISKGGGRQVVVMDNPTANDWAWWIEGNDLVIIFNGAEAADRVIATLDGQEPSAVDDEVRQQLMAAEGSFRPLAFGTWRFDRPGAPPPERANVQDHGLRRADLRWGFDGKESLTVVRLDAPAPRKGFMTVFDQPPLALSELPPIPPDVASLAVLSVDPAGLFDAVVSLAERGSPALVTPIRGFEQSVKERARIDLRNDLLASMGPKVAAYTMPKPAARPTGGNPLGGLVNALAGLGLPQFVVAIEVDDASSFTQKLDGLMLAVNQQLGSLLAMEPPASPPDQGGERRGPGGNERPPAPPEPPKFSMTLANPRTYLLKLPEGLYGLTGYQPTITMGQNHVIFATSPVLARQCRELESAKPSERWSPGGDLAGRLPGALTMLFVDDPTQQLPASLAALPAALNATLHPPTAPPPGNTPEGGPAMASGGSPGGSPDDLPGSGPEFAGSPDYLPSGNSGAYSGGSPGVGGGEYGMEGRGPGSPGGEGQQADEWDGTIRIPPSMIPSSDNLRRFLYPAVYAVSTDDAGVRFEARESLPGQWGLPAVGAGPMLPLPIPVPTGLGPGGGG